VKFPDVSVKLVVVPLKRVFSGSTYQVPSHYTLIVRLEADDDLKGEVYRGNLASESANTAAEPVLHPQTCFRRALAAPASTEHPTQPFWDRLPPPSPLPWVSPESKRPDSRKASVGISCSLPKGDIPRCAA